MSGIIEFFQHLGEKPVLRLSFLVGGLLIFWILEGLIPLKRLSYPKGKIRHGAINFVFTVIHLVIHSFLAILIVLLSDWTAHHKFGLVHWLGLGTIGTIIISFFVLDFFGGWLVHWVEHKVPLFWRLHIIHHSDNKVDVTTGLRHHPGESVLRGIFFMMGIVLAGAPIYAVMFYQTVLVLATAFTHANISLFKPFDKILSYFFVSPDMHKVHHHFEQPYTDSNYGAVLSVWDRVLGTFRTLAKEKINYGLDHYYPNDKDEQLGMLMKRPFAPLTKEWNG